MDLTFDFAALRALSSASLPSTAVQAFLSTSPDWMLPQQPSPALERHYRVSTFQQAWALADAIAQWAEAADHHPTLTIGWGRCTVQWSTHDTGGISAKDLAGARASDHFFQALAHGERP